ncbi:hypothetical protein Tco_1375129 [Tanacetum coccineum]
MDLETANVLCLLAQYLFRHAEGRKCGVRMSGRYFIGRLATHFGLVKDEGIIGLTVIARKPPMIDMDELVKLNISVTEGALVVDEGVRAVPAPVLALQPPLAAAPARTIAQRLSILEEEVHSLRGDMGDDAVVVRDFYKKFYNSLGRVPNHYSSSLGKTRGLSSFSRGIG